MEKATETAKAKAMTMAPGVHSWLWGWTQRKQQRRAEGQPWQAPLLSRVGSTSQEAASVPSELWDRDIGVGDLRCAWMFQKCSCATIGAHVITRYRLSSCVLGGVTLRYRNAADCLSEWKRRPGWHGASRPRYFTFPPPVSLNVVSV